MTTQNIILILLAVEGSILLLITLLGKMTRRIFAVSALITIAACLINLYWGRTTEQAPVEIKQKEYIYMAARLTELEYSDKALVALDQVVDSDNQQYGVVLLRALDHNLQQDYRNALYYLEGIEEEDAHKLNELTKSQVTADAELMSSIVNATLNKLDYSAEEQEKLDACMKLRYLTHYLSDDEKEKARESSDEYGSIADAVEDGQYEDAYKMAVGRAEAGHERDIYLVSEMYLQNYDRHVQDRTDAEYVLLNEKYMNTVVNMNREALNLADIRNDQSDDEDALKNGNMNYESATAEYAIASDDIEVEEAKRIIRYLESVKPEEDDINIAYQFYLAHLCYVSQDTTAAIEALDKIFLNEDIDKEQWLGKECYLLTRACLDLMAGQDQMAFNSIYTRIMSAYGHGILYAEDIKFREFCKDYLSDLYKGISIQRIDSTAFPEITAEIAVADREMELAADMLMVEDTGEEITEFEFWDEEVSQLSICYVLDISGSMEGDYIKNSKKAIRESVNSLEEGTEAGLVFFDNDAYIACPMTKSKTALTSALDGAKANGGTDIAAGLKAGCDQLEYASGKKVIILLSDGYDGGDGVNSELMLRLIRNDIRVYTIGLDGCDEQYLRKIAEGTPGGRFVKVSNSSNLSEIYEDIQSYIARVYYIRYTVNTDRELNRYLFIRLKDSMMRSRREYDPDEKVQTWPEEQIIDTYNRQRSDFFRENGGEAER